MELHATLNATVYQPRVLTGPLQTRAMICRACGLTTFYSKVDRLLDWAVLK